MKINPDMTLISQSWSATDNREVIVEKEESTNKIIVRTKSAFGTWFVSIFLDEDDAYEFAENWIS
jgi:hypothetical protein